MLCISPLSQLPRGHKDLGEQLIDLPLVPESNLETLIGDQFEDIVIFIIIVMSTNSDQKIFLISYRDYVFVLFALTNVFSDV